MRPTIGSLFAGIGGFDLGFERAGFQTLWQVEINDYCRKVLQKHFPHAERFEDVRECGAHNLKPVDVICGGFPCQDISNAGLRAGIDGERSGLWREFARIIGELRPRYVVVENVAALLGRGMGRVLGDLSEIGYDAEWEVISAADVGAPHLRERIWIVAYARSEGRREDARSAHADEGEHARRPALQMHESASDGERRGAGDVADSSSRRCSEPQRWQMEQPRRAEAIGSSEAMADAYSGDEYGRRSIMQMGRLGFASEVKDYGNAARAQWSVEPNVGRVAHGVPARVDRLRALGNAVVPQIPELIARRLLEVL